MNIRTLLAEGRIFLSSENKSCSIDNPALDSALLLCEVLNCSREALIANSNNDVSPDECDKFRKLIERRKKGECTAYILGRKEFMALSFLVNPAVLVPRPETETLVETAMRAGDDLCRIGKKSVRLLDLCTGSGAVAVSIKHQKPEWEISASDISIEALQIAKQNAVRLLPNDKDISFIESDLFSNIEGTFDLIVSNPPYIASGEMESLSPEVKGEPALALDGGTDGLGVINLIIINAPDHLIPGGYLLLEADPRQTKIISRTMKENGFSDIIIEKDLSGQERVVRGKYNAV